jgi:RNA recognition motif-containing protein
MSRLYVGNLSWDTTDQSIRQAFEQDGRTVKDVHIMADRDTGKPRGFAFVEMGSKAEADAAIAALDGKMLDGRNIKVNEAKERPPRAGGGAGYRGGGGGGYGGGGGGGGYGGGRGGGGGGYGGGGGGGRGRGGDRW